MKKGLSIEIINGNVGIPESEPFTFSGNGQKTLMQYLYEDFMQIDEIEDIDYIDVTDQKLVSHEVDVTEVHGKWLDAGTKLSFQNEK